MARMTHRIALVGYGGAGRGIHARLIREAGLTVHSVVVRDPGRSDQAREDWPGAALHATLEELLAAGGHDVVVLASPSGLHEEQVTAVLEAGIRCVVDKPAATDAAAVARLLDVGRRTGTPWTVFHNRRLDPEQLTLRALLADGALGTVHRFERRWERWRPQPRDRWKENDPVGGGLLLDLGTHLVDSAVQGFGPVESVYAELRALTTPTEDDVFLSLVHTGSQVVSHLQAGSLTGAPGPRTRVLGDRGAYLVTSFEGEASPFSTLDDAAPEGCEGWLVRGDEREAVPRASGGHADFYRAVPAWLAGGAPPVDPADALHVARVLDAARVSARTGARVPVDNR